MVLYRKYRPQTLADIVGQHYVTKTLLAQLEGGKVAHGYLFAGPRGTGKTSTARILAKAVNCRVYSSQLTVDSKKKTVNREQSTAHHFGEPCNKCAACKEITDGSYLDLIEIDAASNRGIDEIRDLREKIKLSPVEGRFKVYIIDEVHMLTTEANNALLKTLEEPPAHAIFVLCTTEPGKLPQTIISRLIRFNFKRAKEQDILGAVLKIAKAEKLFITDEAAREIARIADGSYRDALSILDQVSASGEKIDGRSISQVAGTMGLGLVFEFAYALCQKDLRVLAKKLEEAVGNLDLTVLNRDLVLFFEKVMQLKLGILPDDTEGFEKYELVSSELGFADVSNLMKILLVAEGEMKLYPIPQICMLLSFAKWCGEPEETSSVVRGSVSSFSARNATHSVAGGLPASAATPGDMNHSARATRSVGEIKLEDIEAKWGEFLAKVRPANAHVVALLRSARPKDVVDGTLKLEVFFRFHKEKLEEPKIMDLLCTMLSDLIGQKIALKMELAQRTSKPTAAVVKSDVAEPERGDLSKIAEEIFLK